MNYLWHELSSISPFRTCRRWINFEFSSSEAPTCLPAHLAGACKAKMKFTKQPFRCPDIWLRLCTRGKSVDGWKPQESAGDVFGHKYLLPWGSPNATSRLTRVPGTLYKDSSVSGELAWYTLARRFVMGRYLYLFIRDFRGSPPWEADSLAGDLQADITPTSSLWLPLGPCSESCVYKSLSQQLQTFSPLTRLTWLLPPIEPQSLPVKSILFLAVLGGNIFLYPETPTSRRSAVMSYFPPLIHVQGLDKGFRWSGGGPYYCSHMVPSDG